MTAERERDAVALVNDALDALTNQESDIDLRDWVRSARRFLDEPPAADYPVLKAAGVLRE